MLAGAPAADWRKAGPRHLCCRRQTGKEIRYCLTRRATILTAVSNLYRGAYPQASGLQCRQRKVITASIASLCADSGYVHGIGAMRGRYTLPR
ncbi:hypothetical protein KCP69_21680 [Salmonella enterica subsp. enterica]|nr:hypothetical protein KCP69_21680 [Salmonella enterica subsp. enterica]